MDYMIMDYMIMDYMIMDYMIMDYMIMDYMIMDYMIMDYMIMDYMIMDYMIMEKISATALAPVITIFDNSKAYEGSSQEKYYCHLPKTIFVEVEMKMATQHSPKSFKQYSSVKSKCFSFRFIPEVWIIGQYVM